MREMSRKAKRRRLIVALIEQGVAAVAAVAGLFLVCGLASVILRVCGVQAL